MKIKNNYNGTNVELTNVELATMTSAFTIRNGVEIETSKGEILYSFIVDNKFIKFYNEEDEYVNKFIDDDEDEVTVNIDEYGNGDWRIDGELYSIEEIKSLI